MYLEYWQLVTLLTVMTWFVYRGYKVGFTEGVLSETQVSFDTMLKVLEDQGILSVTHDENGEKIIIPGDVNDYIEKTKGKE